MVQSNSRVVVNVPANGLVRLTHIIYLLHGFSVLMGILGPALIIRLFSPVGLRSSRWLLTTRSVTRCAALISTHILAGLHRSRECGYLGRLPHYPRLDRPQWRQIYAGLDKPYSVKTPVQLYFSLRPSRIASARFAGLLVASAICSHKFI